MKDDFDQFGMHYCQRCKQSFTEFMFHLSSGYCNDCYQIVQEEMEDKEGEDNIYYGNYDSNKNYGIFIDSNE